MAIVEAVAVPVIQLQTIPVFRIGIQTELADGSLVVQTTTFFVFVDYTAGHGEFCHRFGLTLLIDLKHALVDLGYGVAVAAADIQVIKGDLVLIVISCLTVCDGITVGQINMVDVGKAVCLQHKGLERLLLLNLASVFCIVVKICHDVDLLVRRQVVYGKVPFLPERLTKLYRSVSIRGIIRIFGIPCHHQNHTVKASVGICHIQCCFQGIDAYIFFLIGNLCLRLYPGQGFSRDSSLVRGAASLTATVTAAAAAIGSVRATSVGTAITVVLAASVSGISLVVGRTVTVAILAVCILLQFLFRHFFRFIGLRTYRRRAVTLCCLIRQDSQTDQKLLIGHLFSIDLYFHAEGSRHFPVDEGSVLLSCQTPDLLFRKDEIAVGRITELPGRIPCHFHRLRIHIQILGKLHEQNREIPCRSSVKVKGRSVTDEHPCCSRLSHPVFRNHGSAVGEQPQISSFIDIDRIISAKRLSVVAHIPGAAPLIDGFSFLHLHKAQPVSFFH